MEPSIFDSDMCLIDLTKITPPLLPKKEKGPFRSPIFAVVDDGEAKVKRVHIMEREAAVLLSDNPDYPPTYARLDTLQVIGKVVWWGHSVRD